LKKLTNWWFSSKKMTIGVTTDEDNIIVKVAPIARWSKGKHVNQLEKWMQRQGNFEKQDLHNIKQKVEIIEISLDIDIEAEIREATNNLTNLKEKAEKILSKAKKTQQPILTKKQK